MTKHRLLQRQRAGWILLFAGLIMGLMGCSRKDSKFVEISFEISPDAIPTEGEEETEDQLVQLRNLSTMKVAICESDKRAALFMQEDTILDFNYEFMIKGPEKLPGILNFEFKEVVIIANGEPVLIAIPDENEEQFKQWVASASRKQLEGIQTVANDGNEWELFQDEILRILDANPSVYFTDPPEWDSYWATATPWMYVVSNQTSVEEITRTDLSLTTVLRVAEEPTNEALEAVLGKPMPNVRQLIYEAEDKSSLAAFLEKFPHVRVLGIVGSAPETLDLGPLNELQVLSVEPTSKESLLQVDLSKLPHPERLRSLSVTGPWSNLKGCDGLTGLEHLWVEIISPIELDQIAETFPELRAVGSINLDSVENLDQLAKLRKLEGISFGPVQETTECDFSPLGQLPRLKYIGLWEEWKTNPALKERIQEACPGCIIYGELAVFGVCLGSGWLILIPAILAFVYLLKRYRTAA